MGETRRLNKDHKSAELRIKMDLSFKLKNVILLIVLCFLSEADGESFANRTIRKLGGRQETENIAQDCRIHCTNPPFRGNYKPNFSHFGNGYPVLDNVDNSNLKLVFAEQRRGRRLDFLNIVPGNSTYTYIKVLEYPCNGHSIDDDDESAVSRQIRVLPLPNGNKNGLLFRISSTLDTECTLFSNHYPSFGVFRIDWSLPLENGYPQLRNGPNIFVYNHDTVCEIRHETRGAREYIYQCSYPCSLPLQYETIGEISLNPSRKTGRHMYRVNPSFDDNCVILSGINLWSRIAAEGLYYFKGKVVNGFQVLRNYSDNTELQRMDDESGFRLLRVCDDDECNGPEEIGTTRENPCSVYPADKALVHNSESVEIGTLRNVYPFTSCHFDAVTDLLKGHFYYSGFIHIYGLPHMSLKDSNGKKYYFIRSNGDADKYNIMKDGTKHVGTITSPMYPCMAEFGKTSTEKYLLEYPITFEAKYSRHSGQFIRIDKRFTDCLLYSHGFGYEFKGYVDYAISDDGLPLLINGYPTMIIKADEREDAVRSNARSLLYYAESDDDTTFPRGFRLKNMSTMEIRFLQSDDPYYHLCFDVIGSSLELVDKNFHITGRVFRFDLRRKEDNSAPNVCGLTHCGTYSTCGYNRESGSTCDCNEEKSFKTEPKDKLSPCESTSLCDPNLDDQCNFGVCRYKPCGESSCRHGQTGSHCVCSAGYVQSDPSDPLSPCDIVDVGHVCNERHCNHGDCVRIPNDDWACKCWEGATHSDPKSPCNDFEDTCSTLDCLNTTCTFSLEVGSKCACNEKEELTWEYIGRPSKCVRKLS